LEKKRIIPVSDVIDASLVYLTNGRFVGGKLSSSGNPK
jgi:hypothetical protein